MVQVAYDVTERNRVRRVLADEETKFRSLAEQTLVGIYVVDAERVLRAM